jgi:hypothetical protein
MAFHISSEPRHHQLPLLSRHSIHITPPGYSILKRKAYVFVPNYVIVLMLTSDGSRPTIRR